ncbi:MAG: hypothetical protein LLG04_03425 [Parachlamydia sp.]|nr:hypothetical protein [Parachlamydia sp.]
MKIEQGPFQAISQLEPQYKEKALAGRFYHTKRTFVVKTPDAYLAVTFTIFERLKAAFLKIIGKDYFSDVLKAKSVAFVTNNELAKLVPIAQAAPVAIPKALPAGVPAQAPVALPAPAAVPAAAAAPAVNLVMMQQPLQIGAGTLPQAPAAVTAAPTVNPGIVQQPLQPAAGALAQVPAPAAPRPRPQLQPAGAPAQPFTAPPAVPGNVPQPLQAVVPQTGQNLDMERIVKRGLPFARAPLANLEALIPKFDDYMKDRQYQETTFNNKNCNVTLIGSGDFNKPNSLNINDFQVFLRLLVCKGRIAAFAPSRAGYRLFEKENQIVQDEYYKPEEVVTRAKLQEIDQHMNQVRFPQPPSNFSQAQMKRFHDISNLIEETQRQRIIYKESKAGEAWELKIQLLDSKEVMDFLVKANVMYAWNYFQPGNSLIVKFAQTDVVNNPGSALGYQAWRDATLIQQEEDFQRTHRIEIPANALNNFKSSEQERLKKIVDLLNKRPAFGQPAALDRQWVDDKLLTWLRDKKLIVGFEASNAIAPFRIYVTEEDKNH